MKIQAKNKGIARNMAALKHIEIYLSGLFEKLHEVHLGKRVELKPQIKIEIEGKIFFFIFLIFLRI